MPRDTPDLRILDGQDELRVVIECKSRRIPFKVRSSPNPYIENEEIYEELVKGVIQIWRYMADVRLGNADSKCQLSDDVFGVILMLEPWLQMHSETIRFIRECAAKKCVRYPEVKEVDKIEISFVAMDDFEHAIRRVCSEGFLRALSDHASPSEHGYLLGSSVDQIIGEYGANVDPYDYHGGISRVVSWWDDIGEKRIPKPPGLE